MKLKQLTAIAGMTLSGIVAAGAVVPASALTFNFTPEAGTSQQAIDGFNAAGALWSSVLTDNVSVNINIGFKPLDAGVLGEASSPTQFYNYSQVYSALDRDRSSATDNAAISTLGNGSTFKVLLNRTANNPNGYASATPYLDNNGNANNSTIAMSTANAKALGLQGNGGTDGNISFNTGFNWDFNRNDGISAGAFDFVGIAAHEIGHALGFYSGVDILNGNSSPTQSYNDDAFTYVNPLDLFRYSTDSKNAGAIDFTADDREKYLSIDRGITKLAEFSKGENFGDGSQASHWLNNAGLGILSPKFAAGNLLQISDNDRLAFDIIGWNLAGNSVANARLSNPIDPNFTGNFSASATAEVPEPSSIIGTFICAVLGFKLIRKRRQKLAE